VRTAATRSAVRVGIEMPDELQPAIDAFLACEDASRGRAALLAPRHMFWDWQDGRSSAAMIALLETVRALRHAGRDVTVLCFDGAYVSGEARDAGMAQTLIAAIDARPDAASIVLCGNLHARTRSLRWMGGYLRAQVPDLLSLDIAYAGGTTWAIVGESGPAVVELRPYRAGERSEAVPAPRVTLFEERDENGYDGEVWLQTLSASPPAR
jgi:hypothetical protein